LNICHYFRLFRHRMGRYRDGFFRDYRAQRTKVMRKSRKFVSSSAVLVDRFREMVEQCREKESQRGQEDREETMTGKV
jgi:hypothetical protein